MSAITTHVLDTAEGRPAAGIPVTLEFATAGVWLEIGRGVTDNGGRLRTLLPGDYPLTIGKYRITFETGACSVFFPRVTIEFMVADVTQHYHVPLLLSPFGYSTYRGS